MENSSNTSCGACGSWWRLPLLLGLVLAGILVWRSTSMWERAPTTDNQATADSPDTAREHVSLVIDFGDGKRRDFDELPWHEGMTVADLIGEARGIEVTQRGSGQGAFVTAIDGVANEGTEKNNWTYEVNGKSGDRSHAVYELRPGDRVLWTFGPQR
jgi:hypothetical protein